MATNISFDLGYKEYTINGDPAKVIRIIPTDFAIVDRAREAVKRIESITEEHFEGIPEEDQMKETDRIIREQLDYIFGEGTCKIAFGDINLNAICNGEPIFIHFLNAIMPVIEKDILAEKEKHQKAVKKYTNMLSDKQ